MMPENWRQLVEDEARTWKGTRYHHRGRVKGVGVDCGGLLYQVYAPFLPLGPFPQDYPQDWAMHKEGHEIYLDFIMPYVQEVSAPIQGGMALFLYGRNYSHGAIVTKKGTFIHAHGRNGFGSVIESRRNFFNDWRGRTPRPVKFFDVRAEYG